MTRPGTPGGAGSELKRIFCAVDGLPAKSSDELRRSRGAVGTAPIGNESSASIVQTSRKKNLCGTPTYRHSNGGRGRNRTAGTGIFKDTIVRRMFFNENSYLRRLDRS